MTEIVAKKRGNPNWQKGVSGNPSGVGGKDLERVVLVRQMIGEQIARINADPKHPAHPINFSRKYPREWMALVFKLLPTNINMSADVAQSIRVEFVAPQKVITHEHER